MSSRISPYKGLLPSQRVASEKLDCVDGLTTVLLTGIGGGPEGHLFSCPEDLICSRASRFNGPMCIAAPLLGWRLLTWISVL